MPSARILNLPFAYAVDFVRPRHRRNERVLVRDSVPVEVPVASVDEAPVAFSLDWPKNDAPLPSLSYEGRLYRQVTRGHGSGVTAAEFEADAMRPARDWRSWGGLGAESRRPAWSGDSYPRLPILGRQGYGERSPMRLPTFEEMERDVTEGRSRLRVRGDDRAARMQEAQAVLRDGLVIVGDGIWSTAYGHEPYWGVREGDVTFRTEADPPWYLIPFRIDRFADAMAYARALSGGPMVDLTEIPGVEVPRPDLLRFDEATMLGRQAFSNLSRDAAGREALGRDAGARYARVLSGSGVDGLASAVALLEDLRQVSREAAPGSPADEARVASLLERVMPALRRWETLRAERQDLAEAIDLIREDEDWLSSLAP